MRSVEVKGKTIEEAIEFGLKDLNTTRDNVIVDVLEESKAGLFNMFGKSLFKVRLTLKTETLNYHELLESIIEKAERLLKLMDMNLEVHGTVLGGRILIKMKGEDAKFVIGRAGDVLNAFEDCLNLMVAKEQKNHIKIEIDVDNYRVDREEKLKCMLESMVQNVLKTEKSYSLNPMNRRDRKIVHLFVDKYDGLESSSQGEGRDRYIVIAKKDKISFE